MNNKAVVVDLDGTLLRCNSFTAFMRFLISLCMRKKAYMDLIYLSAVMSMRIVRLITHSNMKQRVMKVAYNRCDASDLSAFCDLLGRQLNEDVSAQIESYRVKGHPIYLATAAPAIYADIIAKRQNMNGCVATHYPGSTHRLIETRGDVKLRAVKQMLSNNGHELWRVYTDHIDDMPLINSAREAVIVGGAEICAKNCVHL